MTRFSRALWLVLLAALSMCAPAYAQVFAGSNSVVSGPTTTGSLSAAQPATATPVSGGTVPFSVVGFGTATVQFTGSPSGTTFVVDASTDGGSTWPTVLPLNRITAPPASVLSDTPTTGSAYVISTAGYTNVRVRATVYGGTAVAVTIIPSTSTFVPTFGVGFAPQTVSTSALTAVGSAGCITNTSGCVVAPMNGASTAQLAVYGTFALTGVPESSQDGVNWVFAFYTAYSTASPSNFYGTINPGVGALYQVVAPGAAYVRFRVTVFTSGTGNAEITPTPGAPVFSPSTVTINSGSGTFQTSASTTLVANAASSPMSVGFCKSESLLFQGTTTATGTLTIIGANDSTAGHYGTVGTTTALINGANNFIVTLPAPIRYVEVQSSVAASSVYVGVSCSY